MIDITLALGGGGIKGVAHVGVIRFLEEQNCRIRAIAGTSAGGLIGALYAAGLTPRDIEDLLLGIDQTKMFGRKADDGPSLMGVAGLTGVLQQVLGDKTFKDLHIPLVVTATDVRTGDEVLLRHGPVLPALLATSAVPGVFPPRQIGEYHLIDGAVSDPVPVAVARWLNPTLPVVAVALNHTPEPTASLPDLPIPIPGPASLIEQVSRLRVAQAFNIFVRSVEISSNRLTELRLAAEQPEMLVRPEVGMYSMLSPFKVHDLVELGYQAAQRVMSELTKSSSWSNALTRVIRQTVSPPEFPADRNL